MEKWARCDILFWIGVVLWLVSFVIIIVSGQLDISARALFFEEFPLPFLLLYVVLVAPALEEFLFRLLLVKNKSTYLNFLSGSTYFIIPILYGKWYLFVFSVLIIGIKYSKLVSEELKSFLLILLTASCFSLAHIEVLGVTSFFDFTLFLGGGLILGFVAQYWGLKYSMLIHFLYNLFLTLPLFFVLYSSITSKPVIIENEKIYGSLDYVSHQFQIGGNSVFGGDSIIAKNRPLQEIAFQLLDCKNCIKIKKGNPHNKANLSFYSKTKEGDDEFKKNTLKSLIDNKIVFIDSVQQKNIPHYVIKKEVNCNCEKKKYHRSKDMSARYVGINSLIEYCYKKYNKLIVLDTAYKNKCNLYLLDSSLVDMSFNQFVKMLKTEYCIRIDNSRNSFYMYIIK